MWCQAFIDGEREGISTQQAAESLNGAYKAIGLRDGPMVLIAEKAVSREIRILEAECKQYQRLKNADEIVGPRIKQLIEENCVHAYNILKFDVVVTGVGTALVTKTSESAVRITHKINIGLDESVPKCDCRNFILEGIPCAEACAFILRLKMNPLDFARPCLRVETG